ncbi:MAG TPA: HAMP domain-containing sensor histidine kinase [Bryobacteraceae bacterium]|nr:HAMP domain-containing sensor histidine kinase [Bryobacteraceae bacterium]
MPGQMLTWGLALLCGVLAVVVLLTHLKARQARREAMRRFDELCEMRARAAVTESSAAMARLVAAVSHELNNPIGALISAVDTLLLVTDRLCAAPPEDRARLEQLQREVRHSVASSLERLRAVVARMQKLSNLDKTEIQEADLNGLLTDIVALLEPEARGRVRFELRLEALPPLVCRPQQLGAVFSHLLSNALEAVEGEGRVVLSTRCLNGRMEVRIEDNGRGIAQEDLAVLFEPGFHMRHGRVATGHWGLFGARQVIREHGGELEVRSEPGKGTLVRIELPCAGKPGALPLEASPQAAS